MLLNETQFATAVIKLKPTLKNIGYKGSPWWVKTCSDTQNVADRLFNSSRPFRGTKQELVDFPKELHRLHLCCTACDIKNGLQASQNVDKGLSSEMDEVGKLLFTDCKPLTAEVEKTTSEILDKLHKSVGALGISNETKVMIVEAIGLSKGHWFKCPNGHVYAIGECGGAMQRSKCPECQADIGGTKHLLVSDNAVATEMDGSQYSAWSEQANLANYDLQDN